MLVRPPRELVDQLVSRPIAERRSVFTHPRGVAARTGDVKRSGALRLDEALRADLPWREGALATASNGAHVPTAIGIDRAFWRVVGLYLAEGHAAFEANGTARVCWSFHPTAELHLVDEVLAFWAGQGVRARARRAPTTHQVIVQSRLLGAFWKGVLGLARNSYEQRLPDLVWDLPSDEKWALLSGLWEGDGSWSLVNGGPSVVLELGTVSDELADGVLRLLGDSGSWRRAGSVAPHDRRRTPTGSGSAEPIRCSARSCWSRSAIGWACSRRSTASASALPRRATGASATAQRGPGFSELRRERHDGHVYSLEVPYSHTVVTSGGVTTSNCFPKDVDALKQLAGNSGYHFQLLTAVIEVNELQKRRVIGKLHEHLGGLVGKRVALLGLAFKPDTDDMREASSLVLSARLLAEAATVVAYDPVAEEQARALVSGITFASSPLGAVEQADAVVLGDGVARVPRAGLEAGGRDDERRAGGRRAQRPGRRGDPRCRPRIRGNRTALTAAVQSSRGL